MLSHEHDVPKSVGENASVASRSYYLSQEVSPLE